MFGSSDNMGKTGVREAQDREVAGENANYGAILSGSGAKSKLSPANIANFNFLNTLLDTVHPLTNFQWSRPLSLVINVFVKFPWGLGNCYQWEVMYEKIS